MSATQSLLRSYSFASRKRSRKSAKTEARHTPGVSFARRYPLPPRKQVVLLDPKVERVNGRVLARCFSISRAGSVLLSSSMVLHSQSSVLRSALEGVLKTAGSFTSRWAPDATAGLVKDVLGETVDHLHKCASEEITHASTSVLVDWLSKMDKGLLARLAAYSAVVDTPVHQYWEDFLDMVVMPADPNSPLAIAIKVLLDQGLMAPMATALMLVVFTLLEQKKEGRGEQEVWADLQQKLVERLVPDWAVWPMARVIEFTLIPQESRALFEGMVGIAHCAFGLFKLREKLKAQGVAVPISVQDAANQVLLDSMELADAAIPNTEPAAPFSRLRFVTGLSGGVDGIFSTTHSAFSAVSHSEPLPSFRVRTAKSSSSMSSSACFNKGASTHEVAAQSDATAVSSSSAGLVAAVAALHSAGILKSMEASSTRVQGLAAGVDELLSPFSALAHEPLPCYISPPLSPCMSSAKEREQRNNHARLSRLGVVSGSGG